jgi:hypothetical protein
MPTALRSLRRLFRRVGIVLLAVSCGFVFCARAVQATTPKHPSLNGLSIRMTVYGGSGSTEFGGCSGVDPKAEFPSISGADYLPSFSTITVDQVGQAPGWTLLGDTAARAFPNEIMAVWSSGEDTTRVDQLVTLTAEMHIRAGTGDADLYFYTSGGECPGRPVQESSPLGLAFPVEWVLFNTRGMTADSGCGYVSVTEALAEGQSSLGAQFLVTSSAWPYHSEKMSAYVCRRGRVVPTLPHSAKGFVTDALLAKRAALIARKPVQVACANSFVSWIRAFHAPMMGSTIVRGSTAYFEHSVCTALKSGPVDEGRIFARALLAFAREAEYMRGIDDERRAACAVIADLPKLARAWGIRTSRALQRFMATARSERGRAFPGVPRC